MVLSGNAAVQGETTTKPKAIQKQTSVAPVISGDELKGLLVRRAFTPDKASIKDGILEIRQGKDVIADLKLRIITNLTAPYSGKIIKITPANRDDSPHIYISYKKNSPDSSPETEIIKKDYEMYLEFGNAQDSNIPLKLLLKTALATQINIAGNIQVVTADLHNTQQAVKDTVKPVQTSLIDLQQDSLDTIRYVGNEYIRQQFPGELINLLSTYWLLMENAPAPVANAVAGSANQHAEYAAEFSVGSAGVSRLIKLQLQKNATGWQVVNKLGNNLIFAANPLDDKNWLKETGLQGPKVLAARHFELNKYQQSSWQELSEPSLRCGQNTSIGVSYCEVRYKRRTGGDNACNIDTYIFDMKYAQWRIKQILPTTRQFSLQDGQIMERKQSNMMCF